MKIAQSICLLYDAHQSRTDGYINIGWLVQHKIKFWQMICVNLLNLSRK